jgi:hypothetical protein
MPARATEHLGEYLEMAIEPGKDKTGLDLLWNEVRTAPVLEWFFDDWERGYLAAVPFVLAVVLGWFFQKITVLESVGLCLHWLCAVFCLLMLQAFYYFYSISFARKRDGLSVVMAIGSSLLLWLMLSWVIHFLTGVNYPGFGWDSNYP